MTMDPKAPSAPRPAHARLVWRTDGAGTLAAFEGDRDADARLALSIDLLAAALTELGEARTLGRFRTALVVFDGAILAVGRDEKDGSVVVLGDPQVTPGLVLNHLNRVTATDKP